MGQRWTWNQGWRDVPESDGRGSCALRRQVSSRQAKQLPSTEDLKMQHSWEVKQVLGYRVRNQSSPVEKAVGTKYHNGGNGAGEPGGFIFSAGG